MAVASGDRSVSVSGDVRSSVIVTGDNVTLNVSLEGAEGALLDRLTDVRQPVALPLPLDSRPRRFPNHVDRDVVAQAVLAEAASAGAVNLYGEPGIGKSHVLAHVAHLPDAALPDGVVYVPAEDAPLDDVLQALYEEFYDCGSPPARPTRSRLRRELRDRQALVVVDGLALEPAEAGALLEAAAGCTFLVASTERRLRDGATVRLAGLEPRYALELVEQELGRPLTPEERPDAERLCEALAGHPWRIREAAARARDEGRSLAEAALALDPADVLDALTSGERSVLAGLAAAGGGPVGLAHLRELSAVEDVEPVLADLERRHLVHSHSPSYSLAAPLKEEIEARWDLETQREHALAHYTGWSERHRGEPAVAEERPALLGLLRWSSATGRADETIRLGRAVDPALASSGRFGSWGEAVDAVLGAARRSGNEAAEAWALHQRGTWKACLVGAEPGLADLEAARELRERLGDRAGEDATRHNIEVVRGIAGGGGDGGGGGGHGPAFFAAMVVLGAIVVALGLVGGLLAYDRLTEESPTTTQETVAVPLVTVPPVVGLQLEEAAATLEAEGLNHVEETRFADEAPGTVLEQDPAAGREVERDAIVSLVVSRGPEPPTTTAPPPLPVIDLAVEITDSAEGCRTPEGTPCLTVAFSVSTVNDTELPETFDVVITVDPEGAERQLKLTTANGPTFILDVPLKTPCQANCTITVVAAPDGTFDDPDLENNVARRGPPVLL
ncbi:MAG TPA: PASTA domain-containing protein [Gaiellaceae bacterium]|nr:PASTA domain-containing protein [Gaiellaceae bacterium]